MAHSKEAHAKMPAMAKFNEGHWEKKESDVSVADGKYTQGEMSNPEHLKNSVNKLASYAKKHRAQH
jgi:hypothetical protein